MHFDDRDNTLAGSSKFTRSAYNRSNKVGNNNESIVVTVTKLSTFSINQSA